MRVDQRKQLDEPLLGSLRREDLRRSFSAQSRDHCTDGRTVARVLSTVRWYEYSPVHSSAPPVPTGAYSRPPEHCGGAVNRQRTRGSPFLRVSYATQSALTTWCTQSASSVGHSAGVPRSIYRSSRVLSATGQYTAVSHCSRPLQPAVLTSILRHRRVSSPRQATHGSMVGRDHSGQWYCT